MDSTIRDKLDQFFSAYAVRPYKKGQIIIFPGDTPPGIFYLVSGQIRQYDVTYRGDEMVVNLFKPKSFMPMLWAFTHTENRFFYDAATDVEARLAPADKVLEFLQQNPDVTYDLVQRLYIGLDGLLQRMAHLMGGSAKSRVLYELLLASKRFGVKSPDGTLSVMMNETELATYTGLSRETINREIKKLKERDLVEVKRSEIIIKNQELVEKELGEGL